MNLRDNAIFQKVVASEEVKVLFNLFTKNGHTLRLAGGPVRDILTRIEPKDLDFATDATPEQMKTMFEKEEIRMINEFGEKHGTVTARINDKENFEVTTLRIDKVTDGRRADVEFTLDWKLDAGRRDLTVNSMFLGLDGVLYDYYGGVDDLMNKTIRFVGHPVERIQEDYLRIFRYFRFYGRISNSANCHEEPTIMAIKENIEGVNIISGERIWTEWKKIVLGNFGRELTLKMIEVGLAESMGLPKEPNIVEFEKVFDLSQKNAVILEPTSYICALTNTSDQWLKLHKRLKFSKQERDLGLFIIANRKMTLGDEKQNRSDVWPLQCIVTDSKTADQTKSFATEMLKYQGYAKLAEQLANWEIPKFPINGHDLTEAGCPRGKYMSTAFQQLRDIWKNKNFEIDREELLGHLGKVVANVKMIEENDICDTKRRKK